MRDIDWPPVELVDVEAGRASVHTNARHVRPLFDRAPSLLWCELFAMFADNDDLVDWHPTEGMAACDYSQVDAVRDRFAYLIDVTNEAFVQYVAAMPTHEAALLIEAEAVRAAASDGHGEWSRMGL
jgi:hypothetical protein